MKRWKIWMPLVVILGLLIWWTALGLQKSLLVTRDGHFISAPDFWKVGDKVFYKDGLAVKTLPVNKVARIINGSVTDPACYQPLLASHFQDSLAKLNDLKLSTASAAVKRHPLIAQLKPHLPLMAGGLLSLVIFYLGLRRWQKSRRRNKPPASLPAAESFVRLADFSDVESLFLNLFKKKLAAPDSAPAQIEKAHRPEGGPGQVLDLKVYHEGKWQTRHMTLAPIGEGTGSKSQCFYVIFDTHMVVKIPPTPITDFETYIDKVQAETRIMQRLAPKICVIPNLAVILQRIHPFPDADTASPEVLEDRYIRWLHKFPENQRFLTVGGSFVFFMDLARYYFLSHVSETFHGMDAGLAEEIKADIDILSDLALFEGKYGRHGGELWTPFHKAYVSFRAELNNAMAQAEEPVSLSEWNIKGLYLASMAGRDPGLAGLNLPSGFKALLENWLRQTAGSGKMLKQRYRQMLNHYTQRRLFNRSRPLMGGMVTNLLALLAWIGEKQVSLRDLKPDNLLVAGNPDEYPHFLTSARDYAIGLIDLETAVDYGKGDPHEIDQPQLGGTPLYCTPSHFFPNEILEALYNDLPMVLHLQDWYAMVAIIFGIVTGDQLFKGTAYQIPMMMKSVLETAARNGDLKKKFLHFTHQFQDNAHVEMRDKLRLHAEHLRAVKAHVPERIQQQLTAYQQETLAAARQNLRQLLDATPAFNKGNNRRRIENSSVAELRKLSTGYRKRKGGEKLAKPFKLLIRQRQKIESLATDIRSLKGPFPEITVERLLQMMFALVEAKLLKNLTLTATPAPDTKLPLPPAGEEALAETAQILGYSATINLKRPQK